MEKIVTQLSSFNFAKQINDLIRTYRKRETFFFFARWSFFYYLRRCFMKVKNLDCKMLSWSRHTKRVEKKEKKLLLRCRVFFGWLSLVLFNGILDVGVEVLLRKMSWSLLKLSVKVCEKLCEIFKALKIVLWNCVVLSKLKWTFFFTNFRFSFIKNQTFESDKIVIFQKFSCSLSKSISKTEQKRSNSQIWR